MSTSNMNMKVRRFATQFQYSMLALALMNVCPSPAVAQDGHSHTPSQKQDATRKDAGDPAALVKIVRDSTERFKKVRVAEAEGDARQFSCERGEDSGAMGLHYLNGKIGESGALDPPRPQIVISEAPA